jgi:hypothetical protein
MGVGINIAAIIGERARKRTGKEFMPTSSSSSSSSSSPSSPSSSSSSS